MDKWDKLAGAIFESAKQESKDAAALALLGFVTEIARTFEQAAADLDRIATALEKSNG